MARVARISLTGPASLECLPLSLCHPLVNYGPLVRLRLQFLEVFDRVLQRSDKRQDLVRIDSYKERLRCSGIVVPNDQVRFFKTPVIGCTPNA
jgi:hypothetical protein